MHFAKHHNTGKRVVMGFHQAICQAVLQVECYSMDALL